MTNPMMDALAAAARNGGGGIVPVPSQSQREEIAKVQRMQVRTNAMGLAVQFLNGGEYPTSFLLEVAQDIADYIEGESSDPAGPTPLRPRG
jgi:hypothetical protein